MKWLVGPRRIGKSTRSLEAAMNEGVDCIHVSPTLQMAHYQAEFCQTICVAHKLAVEVTQVYTLKIDGKYTIQFMGAEQLLQLMHQYVRVPKHLDDTDQILGMIFGYVKTASGTGPNYNWWPTKKSKAAWEKQIEKWRKEMSAEQFDAEFMGDWDASTANKDKSENQKRPHDTDAP